MWLIKSNIFSNDHWRASEKYLLNAMGNLIVRVDMRSNDEEDKETQCVYIGYGGDSFWWHV